ncbi:HIRAN domain-containing protein [Egicoccus sp. AB-alg6-2]|uniref:HIRAN domain-containing protein n=1 Tax=Egicoccus sp. AB-alg6-2 TaxID=3242692 RepID=UPI00359E780B
MTNLRHSAPAAPPIGAALRAFRTPVRGHAFAARPAQVQAPHPGQQVTLRREPDNPADPFAVAVWAEQWRIGYLDRQVAARLAPRLDAGLSVEARIDGWVAEPQGRWRRPMVLLSPGTVADPLPRPPRRPAEPSAGKGPGLWGRPPGVRIRPVG